MGAERACQSQPCTWRLLALVPIFLSLAASLDWHTARGSDPFEKCMHDPDYEQLLRVVTLGLNRTSKPRRVIVVGAGVAGLVAAKVLSDAGHKVTILEADSRIGGRIFTYRDQKTGWIGELGAMRMPSSHRILHELCKSLGLNLTKFTQYDENTWTEVNEVKLRNYVVEKMPEKLGYPLHPKEKGHSPEEIYQMALNRALKDVTTLGCRKAMKKFERHTLLDYLLGEGNLSQPAVRLLGDVMSKDGFFYLSFSEALRAHSCLSDRLRYSRILGGWDLLPRALLSSLSGPVLLHAPVVAIKQGIHEVSVHVASSRRARNLRSMTADVVLLTVSGPALQRITFTPPPIVYRLWDGSGAVKRWAEDPHSQGGFVVQPPTLWQTDRDNGQEYNWAIPYGRIYFAGEHTAYPHGWVETAVKSALRAAMLINRRVDSQTTSGNNAQFISIHSSPERVHSAPGHHQCNLERGQGTPPSTTTPKRTQY
uniref:L-amino-acid oxidase n=1 Tax=Camelus bactrianus TaxID=9837 RepID=A0A9W3FU53_CAMBA|nr:L-amino-acid oxidase [Camelus bactrianus]